MPPACRVAFSVSCLLHFKGPNHQTCISQALALPSAVRSSLCLLSLSNLHLSPFSDALEGKATVFLDISFCGCFFFGEKERVSAKRQPHFSKAPIKVAFLLKDIIVSCRKGNPDSVKRILQLPFLRNAQGKVWKRATLIPQKTFCSCFFEKPELQKRRRAEK